MKSKITKVLIAMIAVFSVCFCSISIADVGNFESYDSDWGGSSDWGSSSDWESSSDWDYDYNGGSYSGGSSDLSLGELVFIIFIIVVIVLASRKKGSSSTPVANNVVNTPKSSEPKCQNVLARLQEADKYFNQEKFLAWTKDLFVKLQTAWSKRDLSEMRPYETEDLFEQHNKQIQQYIDKKQFNIMDRIAVNYANLYSFEQDDDKDILQVVLNSSMADYIIEEGTDKIILGDKTTRRTKSYLLTFIRKKGVVTAESTDEVKTTNCPNCGAPTKITSSGKCEYCGSVITTGSHDWVLSNLEPFRG